MRLVAAALVVAALAVSGAHAAPPSLTVVAEPAKVGVGDTFAYVVEARLDASMVDASSVRVFADTGPFAQAGSARTTRSTRGSALVVRLEQQLTCLDLACAPVQRRRRIPLPAARVVARLAGGVMTARAARVAVSVEPRVAGAAVHAAAPPYRQQTELPAPMGPAGRLTTLLWIATAALGSVAIFLAVLALRPRATARAHEAELVRALRLLRESAARSTPDRRRAAGLISRVTGNAGARSLADAAAHVAWSATAPEPERAVELAERVEGTVR